MPTNVATIYAVVVIYNVLVALVLVRYIWKLRGCLLEHMVWSVWRVKLELGLVFIGEGVRRNTAI